MYSNKFIESTYGYGGVKFIIHSPILEKLLKKHGITMPTETLTGHIVGDENWYFVADEQMFRAPNNMTEVKEWILAFFESFGHYPLERPIYENDEYLVDLAKSKKLVQDIEKQIDNIIEQTEEFCISCCTIDTESSQYEGQTVRYQNKTLDISPISCEEIVSFLRFFGLFDDDEFLNEDW